MRRLCFGLALLVFAAAARAEDAADRPYLVLQAAYHTAPVHTVLFTPDGKRLISVGEDKTIRIWDAATGEGLGVLRPPVGPDDQGSLTAAALSPDGETLAVGAVGCGVGEKSVAPIFLIDLAGGRVTATLKGAPNSTVSCLAFSHDGKLLASGGSDSAGVLWDVKAGRPLHTLEGPKSRVHHLAFSPNDKLLGGTAGSNKTARIWSVADGKEQAGPLKQEGDAPFTAFAWKDDDTFAASSRGPAGIRLWDRTGKVLRRFDKLNPAVDIVHSLAFVPGGKELFYVWSSPVNINTAIGQSGGSFLDLDSGELRDGCMLSHPATPVCGAVAPDGQWAASCGGEGRIVLWGVKDGKRLHTMQSQASAPHQVYWGDQGAVVAGGPTKGRAERKAFDLGELRFPPTKGLTFTGAVHSRADYRLERSGFYAVEIKRNEESVKIDTRSLVIGYTLLSGDRVAVAALGSLKLYDARTGAPIRRLGGHTGSVLAIAPSPDGRYLLGACSDQTLRLFDPDKEEPLLSLFVAGADWVVWTQEGYYAASPGGEKLMGWQVNHGPDQLGTFYPAEQFHKAFYRPDIIKRVLAEGSVEKARAAADKERGQTTEAVSVAQALPPEVALLSPAAGKLDKAEVEVRAQAESKDRPVVTMRLLLDGRPIVGAEARTFPQSKPGARQEAAWKVTLPDGEHHLVALAETDASLGASAEVVVSWQAAQEPLPTLYVMAVGINTYPGSLRLEWAAADAAAVQKAFQTGGAPKPFGKVETKLLLDRDASREGILAGLDWLKQKMTADDTAVVFYAGHGHRDKKTGQFYLLPQDVNVGDLDKTGVTGTQLKDKLKAAPGRVLVLLDACHSGSIGDSPADPGSLTDDVQRQLAAPDCGVVVMCAAMAQEEAGEAAAVQHGFFTAALLSGLGGGAPRDRKDGLIHLTGLNYYVEEEVAELSKDEQHVVDRPSTLTSFPLVKPPAKVDEK